MTLTDTIDYDLLIIGGGAAGLSCAIYAVRYNLKTIVVSADFGGQILETHDIENWPGTKHITGQQLSVNFEEHARSLGAELLQAYIKLVSVTPQGFRIETDASAKKTILAKTVVLTSGAKHKKLGITGEKEYSGRGVSYCATCDGAFFKNKIVAVIGGGDSAVTGAMDLCANAAKVYLIHRRKEFKAKPSYLEQAKNNPKIEVITDNSVIEVGGQRTVEYILLEHPYKTSTTLKLDGVFIEIGFLPETSLVKSLNVDFDAQGYIKVGSDQATNVPGLFAAGDVTNASNRFAQLVTAASEGVIAAEAAFRFIKFARN